MAIVFDTSCWIEYFLDAKHAAAVEVYFEKTKILTPSIVLLELSYKADKEGWSIESVLEFIKVKSKIVGYSDEFILKFGKIYNDAKKKVRDISLADCIILATARAHDAKVVTLDKHFLGFKEAQVL